MAPAKKTVILMTSNCTSWYFVMILLWR